MSNVEVLKGNLFESKAQTLTNTVNTVGVMGKGIALGFKQRFPEMHADYVRRCERGEVKLGQPYVFKPLVPPWILNFPTKDHWRSVTKLVDIQAGLDHLEKNYKHWGIESLAVPPLGCGEGKLEWRIVGPTLFRGLSQLDIPVELYAPYDTPHAELTVQFLGSEPSVDDAPVRVPAPAVAIAEIVDRVVRERHHYPVGRVALQKIAYFATESGVPTGLEFERRPYGPFAEGLKAMLARLVNNGLLVEKQRGQMFEVSPGPTLDDARRLYQHDIAAWEPSIERVADLFLRLPRTKDAELAASVHFMAQRLKQNSSARGSTPATDDQIVKEVSRWKEGRKPKPATDEIVRTVATLNILGWIESEANETTALATA